MWRPGLPFLPHSSSPRVSREFSTLPHSPLSPPGGGFRRKRIFAIFHIGQRNRTKRRLVLHMRASCASTLCVAGNRLPHLKIMFFVGDQGVELPRNGRALRPGENVKETSRQTFSKKERLLRILWGIAILTAASSTSHNRGRSPRLSRAAALRRKGVDACSGASQQARLPTIGTTIAFGVYQIPMRFERLANEKNSACKKLENC
jgi:hypothetical protein